MSSYIGAEPAAGFATLDRQSLTGDGGTGYTLDHAVANENEIEVFVNNVRQEPGTAYTVSGTTLTMTGNVASTDDFYVVYQGKAMQTVNHPSDQPLSATTGTFTGDVGIGDTSPATPLTIKTDNTLGSTFTGGTNGEGVTIRQSSYTAGNYVSLIEAPYVSTYAKPAVRIGAKFDGSGSSLAFGTTANYASGIQNTAMSIDNYGRITMPKQPRFLFAPWCSNSHWPSEGYVFKRRGERRVMHWSTTNNRFNVPVDGDYFLAFTLMNQTNNYMRTQMYKNGSAVGEQFFAENQTYARTSAYQMLTLAANDYIELYYDVGAEGYGDVHNAYRTFLGYLVG